MEQSTHIHQQNPQNPQLPQLPQTTLTLNNISAQMQGVMLYENVTLTLTEGAIIAVTAPNGTGKTTFLKQLAGLHHIESGDLTFCGLPINRPEDYDGKMIWLGDANGLIPTLTVQRQLEYIATLWGQPQRLPASIHYMQLKPYLQHRVSDLSSGWKRRVALTRLLLIPATLWILDEPFNHLDASGINLLCGLLNSHADKGGMVIFSSPDVRAIPQLPNHRIEVLELMDFIK